MKTQDKNLALMDDIMGAITQADEWQEIQLNDPMLTAACDCRNAVMAQIKASEDFCSGFVFGEASQKQR